MQRLRPENSLRQQVKTQLPVSFTASRDFDDIQKTITATDSPPPSMSMIWYQSSKAATKYCILGPIKAIQLQSRQ